MKEGNGLPGVTIRHTDMGGWLRVFPDRTTDLPDNLGVYLSQAIADWFRLNPHFRLRSVVPLTWGGHTVELHAFYEAHLVAPSPHAPKRE